MEHAVPNSPDFLAGGGEMGARIRARDWTATLGAPETWPQALRVALGIGLNSSLPTAIYWGPDLRLLYNDAWSPIPGPRHPAALGQPAREVWADIWHVIEPQFAAVFATGEGLFVRDQMLPMRRYGDPEETYWNYSFTPIRAEDGRIGGIFNSGHETTDRVLGERRIRLLLALGDRLRGLSDPREMKAHAAAALGRHFRAARAGYAELRDDGAVLLAAGQWPDGGAEPLACEHRLDTFMPGVADELRQGHAVTVAHVATDPRTCAHADAYRRMGVSSVLAAPLVKEGRAVALVYVLHDSPRRFADDNLVLARGLAERTWNAIGRALAEQALRESEARFRNMAEHAATMIWVADCSGHCTFLNSQWYAFTGQAPGGGEGYGWLDAIHPDDRADAARDFRDAIKGAAAFRSEYRLRRADGAWRWVIDAAAPRLGDRGEFLGYIGSVIDITQRKEAEDRLKLLAREVDHRSKNMLSVVQSLIRLTRGRTVRDFAAAVQGRIAALARAHTLLSDSRWQGADLRRLVTEELAPYTRGTGRVAARGPVVALTPVAAQSVAMALHELATNAAKHGALSAPGGHVAVAWEAAREGLVLRWVETGGSPIAEPPAHKGAGTGVIERVITAQLDGAVAFDWRPAGLACTITIPPAAFARAPQASP